MTFASLPRHLLHDETRRIPMIKTTSEDGTAIAADRTGDGPALVLVAPALATRTAFAPLAELLAPHFTVYAYDRRGRGDSGDTLPYAVDREIEDLAAVIRAAGGIAHVFGHSSGAVLALEAAARGVSVTKLALYEPPFIVEGEPMPADFADQLARLVSADRRGEALALWMRSTVRMSDEAIAQARTEPWWPSVEAVVHTTPYDATITAPYMTGRPLPAQRWSNVTMPTLVLDGEVSPSFIRDGVKALAGLLPNAIRNTFPGQGHGAPPEMVAPVLTEFFLAN
jgi:pimeloyl-ACP methyl ester carboxylesterase